MGDARIDARIEAAAKAMYGRDLVNGRVQPGMYDNLRPYYEADASKVLDAADKSERPAVERLVAALRFYAKDVLDGGDAARRALAEFGQQPTGDE